MMKKRWKRKMMKKKKIMILSNRKNKNYLKKTMVELIKNMSSGVHQKNYLKLSKI